MLSLAGVTHAGSAGAADTTTPAHTPHMMGAAGVQPPPLTTPRGLPRPPPPAGQPTPLKTATSQCVVAQPQNYNEQGFASGAGYCAWHDYTQQQFYPGVKQGISFTNMPYVLNNPGGCGENFVNSGSAGVLDGFTIVLGHEVEETVTDPGAEDVINGQNLGAWYD